MSDYGVTFTKGFSLNEALCMLEDDDDILEQTDDVTIFPPQGKVTDEDSGDENLVGLNNLPASQLEAPAEINIKQKPYNDDDFSSEDELPLSRLIPVKSKEMTAKKKKVYKWVKKDLPTNIFDFTADDEISHNDKLKSPLEWFQDFFDENLIDLIVLETNRYTARKNIVQNISKTEIKAFIGVLVLSGYVCVPRRRIYWERQKDGHNLLVSEAIARDKFEHILTNIHVKDNETVDKTDRFSKVRPLFENLNKKFIEACPLEEMHCVDEAMVPYFGRHGCKQFIHGKPIRYGYKLWVGATRLGFVSWFELYQGASTNISKIYSDYNVGPAVVLEYADVLRKKCPDKKFHLYFDNFFTTIALLRKVSEMGLYATGTLRENRISNNPLVHSKTLKKQNRGSYDYAKIIDQDIIIVKWNDNNLVSLASNSVGVNPIHSARRFSRKENKNIQIQQPHLFHLYNANMGGVDRSDQNIGLYRISIRGKKWYFPLIAHCIDLAIQNAWHLHRKFGGEMDQLKFRRRIATALLLQNKKTPSFSTGRPSAFEHLDERYDHLDHLVVPQPKQTRCGHCHDRTTTRCHKRNVGLHVKCFIMYHTK